MMDAVRWVRGIRIQATCHRRRLYHAIGRRWLRPAILQVDQVVALSNRLHKISSLSCFLKIHDVVCLGLRGLVVPVGAAGDAVLLQFVALLDAECHGALVFGLPQI